MALDRHQKLMLRRRQPGLRGLLLAPAQETPERDAKVQEVREILAGRMNERPPRLERRKHRNPICRELVY
jgi:hypothetical protein